MVNLLRVPILVMICACCAVNQLGLGWAIAQENMSPPLDMIEDIAEVQNELGDADVPLTQQQLREILEFNEAANRASSTSRFAGFMGWRQQWTGITGEALTGRVSLHGKGLKFKLRQVTRSTSSSEKGGFLALEKYSVAMGVGDFGLNHGFGLLKSGPGRGAYLAADNKLGPKKQGLRYWAGGFDSGAVRGGMIQWKKSEKCEAILVVGLERMPITEMRVQQKSEYMLRLGGKAKQLQWGLLLAASDADLGISLSGTTSGKGLKGSWEFAGWRVGKEGELPSAAWAMEVGLDAKNNWILEGIMVATDGTDFLSGGQLPYIPAGEGGQGWFLRGGRRVAGSGKLVIVAGKMRHRTTSGSGQRHLTTLLDIQSRWLPKKGVEITGRWRRRQRRSESWSAIYPWQAPHVASQELRSVLTGQMKFKFNPLVTRVMGRLYQQGKDAAWGTRSMVSLSATYGLGPNLALQGSNTTAWGDPIDLVSAISPVAGIVLPRHWGKWREETTFGFRFAWKSFQGRLGYSLRIPENWHKVAVQTSFWAEGKINW